MKILSLYYTHKPGGFCKRLYRLLNALHSRGHEVHFLSLDDPHPEVGNAVTFHRIPFPISRRSGFLFWVAFTAWLPLVLASRVVAIRPDRYLVFGPWYAWAIGQIRFLKKAPLILFMRSAPAQRIERTMGRRGLASWLAGKFDEAGLRAASKIICTTEVLKKEVEDLYPQSAFSIEVLHNDASPVIAPTVPTTENIQVLKELRAAREKGTLLAFATGVFNRGKNFDFLLKVCSELKDLKGKFLLCVAGDGPLLADFRAQVDICCPGIITCPGWIPRLTEVLKEGQLYLHPSLMEGMSNSLLEAMAAGLPVLVSDIPELREVVFHQELLFDPFDAKLLAARVRALVAYPDGLELLRDLSNLRAEKFVFDWDSRAVEKVL